MTQKEAVVKKRDVDSSINKAGNVDKHSSGGGEVRFGDKKQLNIDSDL